MSVDEFDVDADYGDLPNPIPSKTRPPPPPQQPPPSPTPAKQATFVVPHGSPSPEEKREKILDHQMSMPSHHHDPFSIRRGKTLVWKDVNMTLVRAADVLFFPSPKIHSFFVSPAL